MNTLILKKRKPTEMSQTQFTQPVYLRKFVRSVNLKNEKSEIRKMNAKNRMLKQNSLSFGSSDTDTTWRLCQFDLANLRKETDKTHKIYCHRIQWALSE
jgi:hypothetical protein